MLKYFLFKIYVIWSSVTLTKVVPEKCNVYLASWCSHWNERFRLTGQLGRLLRKSCCLEKDFTCTNETNSYVYAMFLISFLTLSLSCLHVGVFVLRKLNGYAIFEIYFNHLHFSMKNVHIGLSQLCNDPCSGHFGKVSTLIL